MRRSPSRCSCVVGSRNPAGASRRRVSAAHLGSGSQSRRVLGFRIPLESVTDDIIADLDQALWKMDG
jgi:hypothetical protein